MRRRRAGEALPLAWLIAIVSSGCAAHRAGRVTTTTPAGAELAQASHGAAGPDELPPRRGLGIAVDPELELPAASSTGTAQSGLAVLAAPVDVRPALHVVDAFFEAISAESPEMLEQLFDRAAHTRAGPKARPEAALPSWRRRFERLDYTPLATELVYRASEVKVHTATDVTDGTGRPLPVVPKGDEVLVQVFPVGAAASKLFGAEVDFVLRPRAGSYKIAELIEDFRLP